MSGRRANSALVIERDPERQPSIASATCALRVLTLTPFYPNSENPAEGCFIAEVLPWTQRMGVENTVAAIRSLHRRQVTPLRSNVPCAWKSYMCVPGNAGLPSAGGLLARSIFSHVERIHRRESIHLIHAHAALPCGVAAKQISEKLGIPYVVSVHGLDIFSERQAGRLLGRWCRRVSERVYRRARAVICISEKVREQIARINGNTRVIYNGVDEELFSPTPESDPLIVLSVGNLIPTKGHALLLQAFAEACKAVPDSELEIIGDGPERSSLIHLAAQLGISARVHFLGRKGRTEVAEAMKRCAVFALPSSYEGLGCVYLEAMACGKPVIGCQGQGIDEVIEHAINGLLVPPGSLQNLSETLRILLLSQQLRRSLGTAARKTILQRYTLEQQAAQLATAYRECVA